MLEGGTARAALQNLFVVCACRVFFAGQQRELTVTGLLWPRATLRRSRIFEHALQKNRVLRGGTDFSRKMCAHFRRMGGDPTFVFSN
jgi:hypothetical protein